MPYDDSMSAPSSWAFQVIIGAPVLCLLVALLTAVTRRQTAEDVGTGRTLAPRRKTLVSSLVAAGVLAALAALNYWLDHPSGALQTTRIDGYLRRLSGNGWGTPSPVSFLAVVIVGVRLVAPVVVGVGAVRLLRSRDWLGAGALVLVGVAAVLFVLISGELFGNMWTVTACI